MFDNEVEAQKVKLEKKLEIEIIAVEQIDEAVKGFERINGGMSQSV